MQGDSRSGREAMPPYRRGRVEVSELMDRMPAASAVSSRVASEEQPATVAIESDSDLEDDGPPPATHVYTEEDKIRSAVRLGRVNRLQREIDKLSQKRSQPTDLDTQLAEKLSKLNTLIGKMPVSFESWTRKWQLRPEHWGDDKSATASGVRPAPQQGSSTARPFSNNDIRPDRKGHKVKARSGWEDTTFRDNAQRLSSAAHGPPLTTQDRGSSRVALPSRSDPFASAFHSAHAARE